MNPTSPQPSVDPPPPQDPLSREAGTQQPGLMRELLEFLVREKKWWLMPIVLALLLLGAVLARVQERKLARLKSS